MHRIGVNVVRKYKPVAFLQNIKEEGGDFRIFFIFRFYLINSKTLQVGWFGLWAGLAMKKRKISESLETNPHS
jgi:hypothetical protein